MSLNHGLLLDRPVDRQRALYAAATLLHLSPVLYPKCINRVEISKDLPYSSVLLIGFPGNTKHGKG